MTPLKQITLGITALAAIFLVVGAVVISELDLNSHKLRIEQLAFEKTGRRMQINGEVNLRLVPRAGLLLHDVTMSNAAEFADTDFAAVRLSELQFEVLPLLIGRVNIKSVSLQGLSLKLKRDADGKTNWDDLMSTTAVVETETDDNIVQEVEAGAPVIAALSVGGVRIREANVSFTDERDKNYFALSELNLDADKIVLTEPFAFESDFILINSNGAGLTSLVSSRGEIAVDLVNNIYRLEQLRISTVNSGESLPVDPLPISFNGELIANLNSQSVDVIVSDGIVAGVPVSGEFHAVDLQDDARLTGVLSSGAFNATTMLDQFLPDTESYIAPELLQNATVSASFDQWQDTLLIKDAKVSLGGTELSGDFQIADVSSSAVLSGQIQSNNFSPEPWARSLGLPATQEDALRISQFSASVRQSGQLLAFNQLRWLLDDTEITGDIEISDINAANLPITYALSVDQIDLDQYLATDLPLTADNEVSVQSMSDKSVTDDAKTETAEPGTLIPVDRIRKLDLDGEVTFDTVTFAGVVAQNAIVPLTALDGRVEVKEATAELYSGTFFSTASLDVQSDEPLLTVTGNLNGLNAEPLLRDALQTEPLLTGIANVSVDLLSRGVQWSHLLERAHGALSLRVTDGLLSGIDISSELSQATRLLSVGDFPGDPAGLPAEDDTAIDKVAIQSVASVTDFTELSLSAVIADGLLQSDDLVFNSPTLQLSGEGGVNLVSRMVDYLLQVLVTEAAETEIDESLQRLVGVPLSLPVRGAFNDLSADLSKLLISAFESDLISEIQRRIDDWPVSSQQRETQDQEVTELIESEKEALRLRLEQEQQEAAAENREEKQKSELDEERLREIERRKDDLKEKLENNLKDGLNKLLGDN